MTKEELEKEAVEYTDSAEEKKHWSDENDSNAVFTREEVEQAYLAGAEPREKRITELEQKLEQTEKDLTDYQFNYPKIKDLEKENAELKKFKQDCETSICRADCQYNYEQLTKAKEIFQEYIRINLLPPIERNFDDEVKLFKQAEQFISEVEK